MITKVPFAAARLAAASSPKRVKEVWAVRAAATNITVEDNTTRIFSAILGLTLSIIQVADNQLVALWR